MSVKKLNDIPSTLKSTGVHAHKIFSSKNTELMYLEIAAGKTLAPHPMPMPVTFFVVKGNIVATVDGVETNMYEEEQLSILPQVLRSISNQSNHISKVLIIKNKEN